jgi:hypothetical protein
VRFFSPSFPDTLDSMQLLGFHQSHKLIPCHFNRLQLLPEHLHDEIDQAAYYIAQQSRSTDRNHTSDAANSYGKSRPSLPFLSTSGPNPILPPLRDLQSSPRHHQQSDRSIRSLDEVPSRSDSRAGRGYGSSQISKDEDHRHHSAA